MLSHRVHNLPAPRTSLFGRERDIAEVRDLAINAPERLVTLTGVGGCGKTRLAIQVASNMGEAFPDGVWLVELARISDPRLVVDSVASTLAVQESASQPRLEALIAAVQPRNLLLVLDNCEHLVDACADLVDHLLSSCPDLRILATSREPLQLAGEKRYRVQSLDVPDLGESPSPNELARCPAVQLFVERAVAVEPRFQLTRENAGAVARICSLLGGIPLAIELAAARVSVLSAGQIVQRLDDCFQLLTGNHRLAPTRQQTLKTALDWSYNLLSERERMAFRRLAVFAAGWSLEGAEAVCCEDVTGHADVLDVLTRLVDKSLVLVDAQAGEARYHLLQPVRQYALQRLAESAETETTHSRLATFCRSLAERTESELAGPEQKVWLDRLERELDNMRVALQWALHSEEWDVLRGLCCALWPLWDTRGYLGEGRQWLGQALLHTDEAPTAQRAKALLGAGTLAHLQCDYAAGSRYLEASLALYREIGDKLGVMRSLNGLGLIAEEQGDYDKASLPLEESLALAREMSHKPSVHAALNRLGNVEVGRHDYERARALFEEGLALSRELQDERKQAVILVNLGGVARLQGDLVRAGVFASEATSLLYEMGDRRGLTVALGIGAMIASARRQARRAVQLFAAIETLAEAIGAPLAPVNRAYFAPDLATARADLGETVFADAWAEGRSLGIDQAVARALDCLTPIHGAETPAPRSRVPGPPDALTPRELDVARLLAKGYSDRQIAAELTITEGTAGLHAHHVLEKAGLRSRAQVADWALARGLIAQQAN